MRTTLIAAIITLAFAGTAHADARLDAAIDRAYTAFPQVAENCPDGVTIKIGGMTNVDYGAEAWWPCEVRLNPVWMEFGRAGICSLMIHEWGHLAGRGHSDDPADVMHPSAPIAGWPECQTIKEREDWLYNVEEAISQWRFVKTDEPRTWVRRNINRKIARLKAKRTRLLVLLGP
jgi:hypothetical protein